MMPTEQANRFADEWIAAWNGHDLDRILAHYTDDFVMTSPFVELVTGESSGTLRGKEAARAYWSAALERVPDLRFELVDVLAGVDSVTVYYRGAMERMAAEVFFFNAGGKVMKAVAHYNPA